MRGWEEEEKVFVEAVSFLETVLEEAEATLTFVSGTCDHHTLQADSPPYILMALVSRLIAIPTSRCVL